MEIVVVFLCFIKNFMLEGGFLFWIVDILGYYEEGERERVFVLNYERKCILLII